jgi:hypothetical protein
MMSSEHSCRLGFEVAKSDRSWGQYVFPQLRSAFMFVCLSEASTFVQWHRKLHGKDIVVPSKTKRH